jgi:hypothetical protein
MMAAYSPNKKNRMIRNRIFYPGIFYTYFRIIFSSYEIGIAEAQKVWDLLAGKPATQQQFGNFMNNNYEFVMSRFEQEWAPLHVHKLPESFYEPGGKGYFSDRILRELYDIGLKNGPHNHVKVFIKTKTALQ